MTTTNTWVEVVDVADLPDMGARVITGGALGEIAIFKADQGAVFAVLDKCPHRGGPLSQGIVHGQQVTCPLHSWVIGLHDGQALAPDVGCAKRYATRLENGKVYLDRNELAETK